MGRKIAIVIALVIPLVAAIVLCLHQPRKPVHPDRAQQTPRVTEFAGVGVALRINTRTHEVLIQQVIANTPAAEAGITNGLTISKVDGVSLAGKPLAGCADLIRGPVGSTVQLELVTPDRSQTNTVELTRRKLKL